MKKIKRTIWNGLEIKSNITKLGTFLKLLCFSVALHSMYKAPLISITLFLLSQFTKRVLPKFQLKNYEVRYFWGSSSDSPPAIRFFTMISKFLAFFSDWSMIAEWCYVNRLADINRRCKSCEKNTRDCSRWRATCSLNRWW